jgi:hypothetical protein
MTQLNAVIEQLKEEHARLEGELRQVDQAVQALTGVTSPNGTQISGKARPSPYVPGIARSNLSLPKSTMGKGSRQGEARRIRLIKKKFFRRPPTGNGP